MSYLVVLGRSNIDDSKFHLFFFRKCSELKQSFDSRHYINTFVYQKTLISIFDTNFTNTKYIGFLNKQPTHISTKGYFLFKSPIYSIHQTKSEYKIYISLFYVKH